MSSLNRIVLLGTIASEPDLKSTNSGDSLLRLRLKVDRPSRDGAEAGHDFITVVMWHDLAEQYKTVALNDIVLVEGNIHTRTYDSDDGKRTWVTEVEAKEAKLVSSPSFVNDDPLAQMGAAAAMPSSDAVATSITNTSAQAAQSSAVEGVAPSVTTQGAGGDSGNTPVQESSLEVLESETSNSEQGPQFNFDDQQSEFSEEFSEEDIPF